MKLIRFLLLGCFLIASVCYAQTDTVPGFQHAPENLTSITPDDTAPGGYTPLYSSPTTPGVPGAAEAITPDIQDLARGLQYNPTRIFNFVHDHIRHVLYFGSKKGAELTLLERSGNDFDQCSLLVALLEASGYTNLYYQFAFITLPYDSSNHQDIHHWLGLSLNNTNWTLTTSYLQGLFPERGQVEIAVYGDGNTVAIQHCWVQLTVGTNTYYLDPSFKPSEPIASVVNLPTAMGLSLPSLWSGTSGTDSGYSIQGLGESSLRSTMQQYNSNLLVYLSNNAPNASVQQVTGGQQITSSAGTSLNQTPPTTTLTTGYPLQTWTAIPTPFMSSFSIALAGTNQFWYMPQLMGGRVSLTFSTNGVATLSLEDSNIFTVTPSSASNQVSVTLSVLHPYGGWNKTNNVPVDTGAFDDIKTAYYQRTNANYAITYSFEASPQWLQERQQKLDTYRAQGLPNTSTQVVNETLNVMGLNWMVQTELANQMICQLGGYLYQDHHRFGRMAQEAGNGYYIDVGLQQDGSYPANGAAENYVVFDVNSYFASAFEYGLIEQFQTSNLTAASTVKMLEIASTNNQLVYLGWSGVWTNSPWNVRGHLTNYTSSQLTALDGIINTNVGAYLFLPQNGSNYVAGAGSWQGTGYVETGYNPITAARFSGMLIPGGYNGGFVSNPDASTDPDAVASDDEEQADNTDPENATAQNNGGTVAEPVRNADGVFEMDTTDLSLGQSEPRGINFGRHYESSARHYNPAGMANGWVHNYYFNAAQVSAPQLGLGTTTPQQMTPMLVAITTALNFYTNEITGTVDPKNWLGTALTAKWGIDQLIKNSVSITMGKETIQFVKQPDGSFTPPANCTMALTNNTTGYNLTARHGNSFRFWTNGLLTNIVDQYGNTLKITYNTNNWVSTITDWTNRSLTFTYTGTPSHLTSVSDSTGRTVSYGYTSNSFGQLDLTAYTDPASKTSALFYDTNHQIIATSNAVGQIVVSNIYDSFGRVITQFTDGNTNMAWQIYWSGYNTLVVDPVGGQQEFIFDDKSRQIGMIDALSNYTRMVYDGQDHVVTNISPLNETNISIFDANNNLVETIDSLLFTNGYFYDSSFNLIKSLDTLGHTNTFGYNAQFSLLSATNQTGDAFTNTYTTTGLLFTRADAAGTTTYGYDTYGQLSTVKYPNSLGTNTYINDALGDVITNLNPKGFTNISIFNPRRQLATNIAPANYISQIAYDAVGNVQSTTDPNGNTISKTWSPTRHMLTTTWPTTAQGIPVMTNGYDLRDWLLFTTDQLTHQTLYSNDLAQRLVATIDPLLRTNTFSYDNDSRNIISTDAASETTRKVFDARGQMTGITNAATNTVFKVFDGNGNQLWLTNRNTNVWHFFYDNASRLTNTTTPTGKSDFIIFNHLGLVNNQYDFLNQLTTFTYDGRKRLSTSVDLLGTNIYQYDFNNNLTNLIQTNSPLGNHSLQWGFDANDRVIAFTNSNTNVIQYGYDNNGNLTSLTYPGKAPVMYGYDGLNRLTNVTDWSGRVTAYTYDLNSRVTSITRPNGTIRTINYDFAGQTTNIIEQAASHAPIAFFKLHWNAAGRVDQEFMAPTNRAYTPPTRTIAYDGDNRMETFNGLTIVNDANGNMTSGPLTNSTLSTYTYDARNRLSSAGGISYSYDAMNNRVAETNGTNVVQFIVDPKTSQVLMRIKNGITNFYVYGIGLIYEEDDTASTTTLLTYHYDYRGSTIALTDTNGNVTDRVQYSVYGMTTLRMGTNDTPFLYNGRYGVQTDTNGLLYMRARYYNPYICRFINPDPSGWQGGINFYVYANGDPISLTDPFGLAAVGEASSPSWIGKALNAIGSALVTSLEFAWNLPNTALGFTLGSIGYGISYVAYETGLTASKPTISFGNGQMRFGNDVLEFLGDLTLGNVGLFMPGMGPKQNMYLYTANGTDVYSPYVYGQHEGQHTIQGNILGPLYLPAYAVGALGSMFNTTYGGGPFGAANFMETGPYANELSQIGNTPWVSTPGPAPKPWP